jgi:SAM-dependent methyltransferase
VLNGPVRALKVLRIWRFLNRDTTSIGPVSYVSPSNEQPEPTHESLRAEARSVYGLDAAGYDAGRPEYPDRVYEVLEQRCGLRGGSVVLECGPGTGQVTRRLVEAGARVIAIEPDPAMAAYLRQGFQGKEVEVVESLFEDALVEDGSFNLAVAATSFHWVDQAIGLPKLGRAVQAGGWVALWWTIFADPDRPDPFHEATYDLFGEDRDRSIRTSKFQLDQAGRRSDLIRLGGLVDVESEYIAWTARLDSVAVRALYASLINVRRLPKTDQQCVLDALEKIASEQFGGGVERPFVTVLYTGRRP